MFVCACGCVVRGVTIVANWVLLLRTVDGVTLRLAWHAWTTTGGKWLRVRCGVLLAAEGARACVGYVAVKGVRDGIGWFVMRCRRQGRVGGWVRWCVMVSAGTPVYVCEATVHGCACAWLFEWCCLIVVANCVLWLRTVDGVTWRRAWHAWTTTGGKWLRVRCRALVAAGGARAPFVGECGCERCQGWYGMVCDAVKVPGTCGRVGVLVCHGVYVDVGVCV
jgi:hypothetical protein